MSPPSILHALSMWAPIVFIRDHPFGMPIVLSFHLLGLTLLIATVFALGLRLSGLALKDYSTPWLARQLRPWTLASTLLVVVTGLIVFFATPEKYLGSNPFRLKIVLLALALLFHFLVLSRFTVAGTGMHRRATLAVVAGLSLTLWFSVGWAGRAIAFIP